MGEKELLRMSDIEILIEDLDTMVALLNTNKIGTATWIGLANSAYEIRKILEERLKNDN